MNPMAASRIYEGTLEEIARQLSASSLAGRRFRVIVVEEENVANGSSFYDTASEEEWEAAMDALALSEVPLPVLPPSAYDRENLYEDRL